MAFSPRTTPNSGKMEWRFYTVPGDPKKPYESEALKKAAETWSGEFWKLGGGGTVWDGMAYDPDANLFYVGTGNGGPWPEELRQSKGKDNLYVASILAVNPDNGQLKWHYQEVPGDSWDFDAVGQLTLIEIKINGKDRKVITQAAKNGFFYVLDRITGEFISAEPFAQVNWASGYDAKGRPIFNPDVHYGSNSISVSPGPGGAHNWSPMSFNPNTGLIYIPTTPTSTFTYTIVPNFTPYAPCMNAGVPGFACPEAPVAPRGVVAERRHRERTVRKLQLEMQHRLSPDRQPQLAHHPRQVPVAEEVVEVAAHRCLPQARRLVPTVPQERAADS